MFYVLILSWHIEGNYHFFYFVFLYCAKPRELWVFIKYLMWKLVCYQDGRPLILCLGRHALFIEQAWLPEGYHAPVFHPIKDHCWNCYQVFEHKSLIKMYLGDQGTAFREIASSSVYHLFFLCGCLIVIIVVSRLGYFWMGLCISSWSLLTLMLR